MHGFHHVLVAGVRPIVLQEVILGNGPDVAFQARRQSAVLQPGIRIAPEVPKMMVRVNDRLRVQHALGFPLLPLPGGLVDKYGQDDHHTGRHQLPERRDI